MPPVTVAASRNSGSDQLTGCARRDVRVVLDRSLARRVVVLAVVRLAGVVPSGSLARAVSILCRALSSSARHALDCSFQPRRAIMVPAPIAAATGQSSTPRAASVVSPP